VRLGNRGEQVCHGHDIFPYRNTSVNTVPL
jgi:hypothetical protein